eukprot:Nk52_evm66s745 gene=Nk52_evmTU66s745
MTYSVDLDAKSYVILFGFILSSVFVVRPVKLSLCKGRFKILLDYGTVPLLITCLLVASTVISLQDVSVGFLGEKASGTEDEIQPYTIIILFFSLAYLCISVDLTGIFECLSLYLITISMNSGKRIFLYFYFLSGFMTVTTNNDVVIMTLTPIVCYFSLSVKTDPRPFLVAQFMAAHIWSMALYVSNPTNVIVAESNGLSFFNYSKWMVVPTVLCGMSCVLILLWYFRSEIPSEIVAPELKPLLAIKDKWGAIFGSSWLFLCLATIIATSTMNIDIWMVTLPFAGVLFCRDLGHDMFFIDSKEAAEKVIIMENTPAPSDAVSEEDIEMKEVKTDTIGADDLRSVSDTGRLEASQASPRESNSSDNPSSTFTSQPEGNLSISTWIRAIQRKLPTLAAISARMPWKVLPFIVSMFILVEGLNSLGWVERFAAWLGALCSSVVGSVYVIGVVATIVCNLINNQPMTILFTSILQHENFKSATSGDEQEAGLFAVVIASNIGANFTLVGALAGLMWASILRGKGFPISFWEYFKIAIIVMPAVLVIGCGTLAVQFLL